MTKKTRNTFFVQLNNLVQEKYQGVKIIGGDFNDVLNKTDRISKHNTTHFKICTNLLKLIKEHNLIDIWKTKHNDTQQLTWRRKIVSKKVVLIFGLLIIV